MLSLSSPYTLSVPFARGLFTLTLVSTLASGINVLERFVGFCLHCRTRDSGQVGSSA